MDKTNIVDEQGYFWWRDEKYPSIQFAPEQHVTGWLRISENGEVRLELDGVLPTGKHPLEQITDNLSRRQPFRSIQGITKKTGKRVLLIDAVGVGGQFNSTRFSFEKYIATMCLVGDVDLPRKVDTPRFSAVEVDLTGFENWLHLGTLDFKNTRRAMTLKSEMARDVIFNTSFGKLVFEKHTEVVESNGLHRFEVKVREYMTLTFQHKKALAPEQVRDEFGAMQDLMTLLTNSHFSLAWPVVKFARTKEFFNFYFRRIGSSASPPELQDLPISFVQLQERFGALYEAWRTKRDEFGAGFYSYLSTKRDVNLYVENHFANLVQGMEYFHRTKYISVLPDGPLQEKITRILNGVESAKDKRWLAGKLRHAAEPSLEERLNEIFTALPLDLDRNRLRSFAKSCADIRNDLAHFGGQRTRERSADFLLELSRKSVALGFFYHMTLLREIGLSDQMIKEWLRPGIATMRARAALVESGILDKSVIAAK
ncbi:ApeA N-terminal domain 1-containing protein [Burkholderia gladioli]|uniref:ApeA N-terminal domain 1-containing protein n=1 Tax=Burkholderia gladioli TaxID=28095 RepID=UPI0019178B82|nr:HEPN domain-containing protein [Burkholderia gladioli]